MYIDETMNYIETFQALQIELQFPRQSNIIYDVIYSQRRSAERFFRLFLKKAVDRYSAT